MTVAAIDLLKQVQEASHNPVRAQTEVGRVAESSVAGLAVSLGRETVRAQRAATCLLVPRVGDEVLVAALNDGRAYVLAILQTADPSSSELELEGDVSIKAGSGRLCMAASEELEMVSPKSVSVTTSRFSLRSVRATLFVDGLEYLGNRFVSDVHKVKTKVGTLDSVADRISQHVKQSYRTIQDSEYVRAGKLDISAKTNLRMHAKNALITALSLVKVDGEQIHMG